MLKEQDELMYGGACGREDDTIFSKHSSSIKQVYLFAIGMKIQVKKKYLTNN